MIDIRLIDGDTINLAGIGSVRLAGIDAPENGQMARDKHGRRFDAGEAATDALFSLIDNRQNNGWEVYVEEQGKGRDRYGRIIGTIMLERGRKRDDACAWMVRHGWAVAEYGPPDYKWEERQARLERAGLWAGEWERPRKWRAARRNQSRTKSPIISFFVILGRLFRLLRKFR